MNNIKQKILSFDRIFVLAAGLGFEPRQTESESVVLPLHNPAICNRCRKHELYYSKHFGIVKGNFSFFKNIVLFLLLGGGKGEKKDRSAFGGGGHEALWQRQFQAILCQTVILQGE